jgi:hypothetical protein
VVVNVGQQHKRENRTEGKIGEDVFLHIFANVGQVNLGFDTNLSENFGITDAR